VDKQQSDCSNSRVIYGNSSHRKADLENLTKMCYAYGKQISRTGTSNVIFGYNGRDGVVTDANGLIYMRARYYSPEMRRFINADIIPGEISNAITLNRFAYANGNPVSNVDPFGLSTERGSAGKDYLDMRKILPWNQLELCYNLFSNNESSDKKINKGLVDKYEQYGNLIIAALEQLEVKMKKFHTTPTGIDAQSVFEDAKMKIIEAINKNTYPDSFLCDAKFYIEINSNFNRSGSELTSELIGFVPYVGELVSMIEILSNDEIKDIYLFDTLFSLSTQEEIAKLTPYFDDLKILGNFFTVVGVVDAIETIANINSSKNKGTDIVIYYSVNGDSTYMYEAFVDNKFNFDEFYSGYIDYGAIETKYAFKIIEE